MKRCRGCGYVLPRCDCDQRALTRKGRLRRAPAGRGTSPERAQLALDILGGDCPPQMRKVAEARIASPHASWNHVGAQVGLSRNAASSLLYYLLRKAGV